MIQPWLKEDEVVLGLLWDAGLSASQIAEKLGGRTRNAVLGKVWRLGLPTRNPERSARRRPAPVPSRKAEERKRRMAEAILRRQAAARVEPVVGSTYYDDLTPWSCRWIPGEPDGASTLYCGDAVVPGKSYCECHLARMFRVVSEAQDKAELKRFARAAA